MAVNFSAIGKRVGKAIDAYGGRSDGTGAGTGASTGRKVGSMLRRGFGKVWSKRKGGQRKPVFKYGGKTMSA